MSELLPHLGSVADELCILRAVHTEAINHDPAVTYLQTGHQQPGRPSMGAWLSYGLGSENEDLPAFVVLVSRGSAARPADPLYARLWGAEFLPSQHQGTQFRSDGEPVLFLSNPAGISRDVAPPHAGHAGVRSIVSTAKSAGDAEIEARIAQYEKAFRMQTAVPELVDLRSESADVLESYGPDAGPAGNVRHELPAGAAAGRARRAVRAALSSRLGPALQLARRFAAAMRRCRSAVRGA